MVVWGLFSYSQQELALVYHVVKRSSSLGAAYEVESSSLQRKQIPSERWRSYSILHLTLNHWSIYQSFKTDGCFLVKEL